MAYLNNPRLNTIIPDYPGNKLINGRFVEYASTPKSILDILRWKKEPNRKDPDYVANIVYDGDFLRRDDDYLIWLGHATFLFQIAGKRIITDPVFYAPPFTRRLSDMPIHPDSIEADYILISHGHYDHLDAATLKGLSSGMALVPLGMAPTIAKINASIETQEAGWYQKYDIDDDVRIYLLPALHWHKRTLWDTNKILWGSYIIETSDVTIYFAGDTAYGEHFAQIGELFDIDIALLPIGAYEPEWFMGDNHLSPRDAIRAMGDLGAEAMIPMHYGTFDLASEEISKPERVMRQISDQNKVRFAKIGEAISVSKEGFGGESKR